MCAPLAYDHGHPTTSQPGMRSRPRPTHTPTLNFHARPQASVFPKETIWSLLYCLRLSYTPLDLATIFSSRMGQTDPDLCPCPAHCILTSAGNGVSRHQCTRVTPLCWSFHDCASPSQQKSSQQPGLCLPLQPSCAS